MSSRTVLFIDDDPDMLRLLRTEFERLGHRVYEAESGSEGLALHERARPDVTVLDLSMPGMSGLEVLEILRKKRAMVIMLTASGELGPAVEAMRLGAENFLTKPVNMGHLAAAVERAAENAAVRQANVRLRARLRPTLRRRLLRSAAVGLLVLLSVGTGRLIGHQGADRRSEAPIPVPLDASQIDPGEHAPGAGDGKRDGPSVTG